MESNETMICSTESQDYATTPPVTEPVADSPLQKSPVEEPAVEEPLHKRRRSNRNTAKTVNYQTLANGRPPRAKRGAGPRSKHPMHPRQSPEISKESSEAQSSMEQSPPKTPDGESNTAKSPGSRPTQGGKSPIKLESLKQDLIKDHENDHSERASSLSPMPEDLESENSPVIFSGNGLLKNGGRFQAKCKIILTFKKSSSPEEATSKKRRRVGKETRDGDKDVNDGDEGDDEQNPMPAKKARKTSQSASSCNSEEKNKKAAFSRKRQPKSPKVQRKKPTPQAKKIQSPRNSSSGESETTVTPQKVDIKEDSESESAVQNSPQDSESSANSETPITPPYIPPLLTQQDKYVPTRPMTNNQAIKLFDFMAARMDWHSKELFDEAGIRNMLGNRRAAAERFFKGEVRKLLIAGLAEAEGRMCKEDV